MSTHDETGVEDPGEAPPRAGATRFPASVLVAVAAGLAVLLVASIAVSVVFWLRHHDQQSTADQATRDRADALAAADSFVLAMDDVDGAKFDTYISTINKLLTTKARTKNLAGLKALKTVYEKGKVKGTGKVLASGVGDAGSDTATVLVVHDTSVSSTAGQVVHHYRWTVSMEKVGGTWLVDDFTPTTQGAS